MSSTRKREAIVFDERELLYVSKLPRTLRAKLEALTGRPELNKPPRTGKHWAEKRAAKQYLVTDVLGRREFVTAEQAAALLGRTVEKLTASIDRSVRSEVTDVVDGNETTVRRIVSTAK